MPWTRLKSDTNEERYVISQINNDQTFLSLQQTGALLGYTASVHGETADTYEIEISSTHKIKNDYQLSNAQKNLLRENIRTSHNRLSCINQQLYSNPELGNEEQCAAEIIVQYLKDVGFSVELGLQGKDPLTEQKILLDTAFKAVKTGHGPGPVITIMVEYDALPMGHACGHNLISVSGLAAASALAPLMKDVDGELRVIGTPAEEGGKHGGKIPLLAAGHFQGSDIVLITHPGDRWDTGAGFLAITGGRFTFYGIASHPAAPGKGTSALDAAVLAYTNIEMIREHIQPDARIHGIFKEGGTAANIVPGRAVLSYAVRALEQPYVEVLKKQVEQCVQAGATAVGATVDIRWSYGYRSPINVPILDQLVLGIVAGERLEGIKKWEALGSSDLGNVGYMIPTCNLWFKIASEGVLPHTHEFLEAAGGNPGFLAALDAGYVFAVTALTLFEFPELVKEICFDFTAIKEKLLSKNFFG